MGSSRRARFLRPDDVDWTTHAPGTFFRLPVHVTAEGDGGFSAVAANLPGCVGEGHTFLVTLDDIREAAIAALLTYRSTNMPPPWQDEKPLPPQTWRCVIFVTLPEDER